MSKTLLEKQYRLLNKWCGVEKLKNKKTPGGIDNYFVSVGQYVPNITEDIIGQIRGCLETIRWLAQEKIKILDELVKNNFTGVEKL